MKKFVIFLRPNSVNSERRRGVRGIHCFGVDNALVKVADPEFIGFALEHKCQCVNKVVLKVVTFLLLLTFLLNRRTQMNKLALWS